MNIIIKTLIISHIFIIAMACSHQRKNPSTEKSKLEPFQFSVQTEISKGNHATFELLNTGNEQLTMFSPYLMNIEKQENENWRKIRILYCPCGADCEAPPELLILKPEEKHSLSWNLNEGWCDKKMQNGIPATIEKFAGEGVYRISIQIEQNEIKQTIIKEFAIIN